MTTRCYYIENVDPYFNLATEEYLLKHCKDDVLMLWSSERTIVVGKHQNALAEINHAYVKQEGLKVARRLSGGGTVFHDLGNLNFTFIRNMQQVDKTNYAMFLEDVKAALKELGLAVYNSERDDLMLDGFKISGNAQHIHKNRVLHHGTLLFNSELSSLKRALKVDLTRFEHKAVQSKRSKVANVYDFLEKKMSMSDFADHMFSSIANRMPNASIAQLNKEELEEIAQLSKEKYSTWDWIYGYSPKYIYRNTFKQGECSLELKVQKGKITDLAWGGISKKLVSLLNDKLILIRHEQVEVSEALEGLNNALEQEDVSKKDLLLAMF